MTVNSDQGLHYKSKKCKLDHILRYNIDYTKFYDYIRKADLITKQASMFIRAYLLFLFEEGKPYPSINSTIVDVAYKVLSSKQRKLRDPNTVKLFEDMSKYYNDMYTISVENTKIDTSNISHILQQTGDEFIISFQNNITYHYHKHVLHFIRAVFKQQITDTIDGIKSKKDLNIEAQNSLIKEAKSKHYFDMNKILDDILEGTLLCPEQYHKWVTDNRKLITLDQILVRKKTVINPSFEVIKSVDITLLVKHMFYMNKYLESKELKTLQVCPIKTSLSTNHIKINTQALIDIFCHDGKSIMFSDANKYRYIWHKIFMVKKIKVKGYAFNFEIQTDGYCVSLNFIKKTDLEKQQKGKDITKNGQEIIRNMTEEEKVKYREEKQDKIIDANIAFVQKKKVKKKSEKELIKNMTVGELENYNLQKRLKMEFPYIEDLVKDDQKYIELRKAFDQKRIIVVDPGKRSVMTMLGDNDGNNNLDKLSSHEAFFNYTNTKRVRGTRRLKYGRWIETFKNVNKIGTKTIKDIETKLKDTNSKSCNHARFLEYIKRKNQISTLLYSHELNEYIRRLKWYMYINTERHNSKLMTEIAEKYDPENKGELVIIFGDWSNKGNIKYMSTPNVSIKRKLKEKFKNVYQIDEFRTSKMYYKHGVECDNMTVYGKFGKRKVRNSDGSETKIEVTSKKVHSVLRYKFGKEMGCINRDKNACMNMKKIVVNLMQHKERPEIFRREKNDKIEKAEKVAKKKVTIDKKEEPVAKKNRVSLTVAVKGPLQVLGKA